LPDNTRAELYRCLACLRMVRDQIQAIEKSRLQKLTADHGRKGPHAMVCLIARVLGIGVETADMLVTEVFSRRLRDRKAVARYAGLTVEKVCWKVCYSPYSALYTVITSPRVASLSGSPRRTPPTRAAQASPHYDAGRVEVRIGRIIRNEARRDRAPVQQLQHR